jgi:hypothetical protein
VNYHFLIDEEVKRFRKIHPKYTYGQIIYAALLCMGKKEEPFQKKDLLRITDKEIFSALSRAIIAEKED